MFTHKSKEYIKEKDQIIEQMKNFRGEPNKKYEKIPNKKLYDLFEQENLKCSNKPIYSLRLDGETESCKRRVFSKNFKLDENNQFGFAMTKPLPIGVFKCKQEVSMEILDNSVDRFDPNSKIGEIFVVDIEFDSYDVPREKMYNEVFPCIFESKSKVTVDNRSLYQLLSTMSTGKMVDVLKLKATEKTHATLRPKKRLPMFIDHTHFLTKRVGWKVTKVHKYYTFEQEPFKRQYILKNIPGKPKV